MIDLTSFLLGAGSLLAFQIAYSIFNDVRKTRRTEARKYVVRPKPAEWQHLSVEIVETFEGLCFRRVGTDLWQWVGSDGSNKYDRWEPSYWKREGVFALFYLLTYHKENIETARVKAQELADRLVAEMYREAYQEDRDRQRAAFKPRVVQ